MQADHCVGVLAGFEDRVPEIGEDRGHADAVRLLRERDGGVSPGGIPPDLLGADDRIRQPTTRPVSTMTTIEMALSPRSAIVRPTSTADRDIGSERNRSIRPFCRSSAMLAPVIVAPKITVCARIPGSRKSA